MRYGGLGVSPGWGGFVGGSSGEVVDHRDADHGGGCFWEGFVVAGESAVLHEPADDAFDDPSAFDDGEAFDVRVFGDDFDVDAEVGAVLDDFGPEAGIDLGLGDGGVGGGGAVE